MRAFYEIADTDADMDIENFQTADTESDADMPCSKIADMTRTNRGHACPPISGCKGLFEKLPDIKSDSIQVSCIDFCSDSYRKFQFGTNSFYCMVGSIPVNTCYIQHTTY